MKAISAAIIVLAGAILLAVGSQTPHTDTKAFVMIVGCLVGLLGLGGWWFSLKEQQAPPETGPQRLEE